MAAAGLPDSGSDNPAARREAQQLLGPPGRRGHAGRELRVRGYRVLRNAELPSQPAQQGPAPVLMDTGGRLQGEPRPAARPAVDLFRAADHRCRLADLHLRGRLHGERPGAAPLLRVHGPVRGGDAAARPGRQLPRPVRGVGGRWSCLVPADRVLAVQAGRGDRRQEGVHRQQGGRRRPVPGHHADVRPVRHRDVRGCVRRGARRQQGRGDRARAAAAARGVRQIGPAAVAVLAARRDGRPDPGVGADPRGDDGDRGGLPDRPVQPDLRPDPGRPAGGRDRRRGDAAVGGDHRMRQGRHQEVPRWVHDEPDRLHVPGRWARPGRRTCSRSPSCSRTASSRPRCS